MLCTIHCKCSSGKEEFKFIFKNWKKLIQKLLFPITDLRMFSECFLLLKWMDEHRLLYAFRKLNFKSKKTFLFSHTLTHNFWNFLKFFPFISAMRSSPRGDFSFVFVCKFLPKFLELLKRLQLQIDSSEVALVSIWFKFENLFEFIGICNAQIFAFWHLFSQISLNWAHRQIGLSDGSGKESKAVMFYHRSKIWHFCPCPESPIWLYKFKKITNLS